MHTRKVLKFFRNEKLIFFIFVQAFTSMVCGVERIANLSINTYASHSRLMPYKGYQNDLSVTAYIKFEDWRVSPFLKTSVTEYRYQLSEGAVDTTDHRYAFGGGLDYKIYNFLKARLIFESITNESNPSQYNQDSYGLIYNQYLEFSAFQYNGYAESFYIPRVSTQGMDTYLRLQILKGYDLYRADQSSHVIYPFLQLRAKENDNALFGITGSNFSGGLGYKFYTRSQHETNEISLLAEGHSVFYQSKKFNGDWLQALIVLQWIIN